MLLDNNSLLSAIAGRTAEINLQVMEEPVVGINYMDVLPVGTDYQPFALAGGSSIYRFSGEADFLNGESDDVPMIGLDGEKQTYGFAPFGVGYGWNMEEIGIANQYGATALDATKARGARRKSEEFVQKIAMVGHKLKKWKGLLNQSVAPVDSTTPWRQGNQLTATPEQILFDVDVLIDGEIKETPDPLFIRADTVAVDWATYRLLGITRAGGLEYGTMTIRQVIEAKGVKVVPLFGLEDAGANGKARAIGYANRIDVIELPVTMGYHLLEGRRTGAFKFEVPGWGRLGGVQLHNKGGLRYMDKISK